jgi:hypothetical protein
MDRLLESPPLQSVLSGGGQHCAVRGRCDSARWQYQLHSACLDRHVEPLAQDLKAHCSSFDFAADARSEAVAGTEGFDSAASQPIARTNIAISTLAPRDALQAGGELRSPGAELARVWPHRRLNHSKSGASRARSISGRTPLVKRIEMRRAEARCRLKSAPQFIKGSATSSPACRYNTVPSPCA